MDWLSAPEILEDNPTTHDIVPTLKHEEQILFPHPTAEFNFNGQSYLMTSSFGGRITFSITSKHFDENVIYLGTIDGIPADKIYEELSVNDLQYFVYRGNSIACASTESTEFEIFRTAMWLYIDTPIKTGLHEGWDQAIKNSRTNIARILDKQKENPIENRELVLA